MTQTIIRGWRHAAVAAVFGAAASAAALPAHAGAIALDTFLQFSFTDAGSPATGCEPADPAGQFCVPSSGTPTQFLDAPGWTFDAPAGGALLRVVDAFESGDQFEVFDFGVSIGFTSLVPRGAFSDCGDDPVNCLADPIMSKGSFALGAGSHSLSIVPVRSPNNLGSAYLDVSAAAVPLPGSLLMAALGLGLMRLPRREVA